MRRLALLVVCLVSNWAFAAADGQISMASLQNHDTWTAKTNFTEGGLTFSSVNSGTMFATLGLVHEFVNGIDIGIRGYLPVDFERQTQTYMGEIFGRFMLVNDTNQIFVDAGLDQGVVSSTYGTFSFPAVTASLGFLRKLTADIAVGGLLGADYTWTGRLANDTYSSGVDAIYSKLTVNGTYYF